MAELFGFDVLTLGFWPVGFLAENLVVLLGQRLNDSVVYNRLSD